jgi:hypothetical protein
LYYIETLINGKEMDFNFDAKAYRLQIKKTLLKESLDASNFCLHCGAEAFNDISVNWVHCVHCKRWFHSLEACLHIDPESMSFDSDNYKCELCLKFGVLPKI